MRQFDEVDGSAFVIDLEAATSGHCCHAFYDVVLLQRLAIPLDAG